MALKTLSFALVATGMAAWYASNKRRLRPDAPSSQPPGASSSASADRSAGAASRIASMDDASNASSFERGSELSGNEGVASLSRHSGGGGRADDLLSPDPGAASSRPYQPGSGL